MRLSFSLLHMLQFRSSGSAPCMPAIRNPAVDVVRCMESFVRSMRHFDRAAQHHACEIEEPTSGDAVQCMASSTHGRPTPHTLPRDYSEMCLSRHALSARPAFWFVQVDMVCVLAWNSASDRRLYYELISILQASSLD